MKLWTLGWYWINLYAKGFTFFLRLIFVRMGFFNTEKFTVAAVIFYIIVILRVPWGVRV